MCVCVCVCVFACVVCICVLQRPASGERQACLHSSPPRLSPFLSSEGHLLSYALSLPLGPRLSAADANPGTGSFNISTTPSTDLNLTSVTPPLPRGYFPRRPPPLPSPSDQPDGRVNRLSLKGNSLRQTPVQEPLRHINSNRKASDWHIRIRKPQVIIGDSNLSKISSFRDENLQIDRQS